MYTPHLLVQTNDYTKADESHMWQLTGEQVDFPVVVAETFELAPSVFC